jgi:hypothetical protein
MSEVDPREYLSYDPETGIIRWIKVPKYTTKAKAGDVAGTLRDDGYLELKLLGKKHKAHRLVWFLHYGVWPTKLIDHENGIRVDNSIKNLREATHAQNQQNRSSEDVKGISYHKRDRKWQVRISANGIQEWVGAFTLESDAITAYQKRKAELHTFSPVLR